MITTKFLKFLEELVSQTMNGNIEWENYTEDGSSYRYVFEEYGVEIKISIANFGNSKEVILDITRNGKSINVIFAPKGSDIDNMLINLFESVYSKKLNAGLSMLEDNRNMEEINDDIEKNSKNSINIMDIFKKTDHRSNI